MEDVDPSGRGASHPLDFTQVRLELYRLVAMFLSTGPITDRFEEAVERGAAHPDPEYHFMQALASSFFFEEMSRILTYTAIQCRLYASAPYPRSFDIWEAASGELETSPTKGPSPLGAGPLRGTTVPLTLREAFNKIIHAEIINTDSEHDEFAIPGTRLNPVLYLYGRQNGRGWRARLCVWNFVRLVDRALPRIG